MGQVRRLTLTVVACSVFGIAVAAQAANNDKVLLCHGTASDSNPYVLISVSENALASHLDGTAPGHGKNNYPDFVLLNGRSDCSAGPVVEGGSE